MKTKTLKCPARITEYKDHPHETRYVYNKDEHSHAELKRGKYLVKSDIYSDYSLVEESVIGTDYEYMIPNDNE